MTRRYGVSIIAGWVDRPHYHQIAGVAMAVAVALKEANTPEFQDYTRNDVIVNAQACFGKGAVGESRGHIIATQRVALRIIYCCGM